MDLSIAQGNKAGLEAFQQLAQIKQRLHLVLTQQQQLHAVLHGSRYFAKPARSITADV